jgi:hypothetical protein
MSCCPYSLAKPVPALSSAGLTAAAGLVVATGAAALPSVVAPGKGFAAVGWEPPFAAAASGEDACEEEDADAPPDCPDPRMRLSQFTAP